MAYKGRQLHSMINKMYLPKTVAASSTWTLTSDEQEVSTVEGFSVGGLFLQSTSTTISADVVLEASVDGSNWFDFATVTFSAANAQKIDISYVAMLRIKSITNNAAASLTIDNIKLYREEDL